MRSKPLILVVDDQPKNIELLEAYLIPPGYEIIKAESGQEALERLSCNQVDLVLLDIMMPNMSGFEVLKQLRADQKTRLIPVVMITALNETEDRVKALEAGCDDFISKPFDKQELLVRVESLLRIKFLHDEADAAREYAESIVNTVREPLISLDQDLRIVTVSRSFYEVFKVKPEETVGQLIYDLGNKQWDIPKLRELLEDILPKKAAFDNFEVEHDFVDIGHRVMLLNARQIQRASEKERIILLSIEDITERKRMESTSRLATVVRDSNDAITIQNVDGNITAWNRGAEQMFGYSEQEALTMSIWQLVPLNKAAEQKDFNRLIFSGEKVTSFETQRLTKAGQLLDVWLTATRLMDNAGKVIGIASTERNITERKHLEEQLLQSQKMDAIGTLTGGIAHDFNNLLTVILGNCNIAMKEMDKTNQTYKDLSEIHLAATRAATLTRQLLLYSRKQPMGFYPININKTINELLKMVGRLLGEDITMSLELDPNILTIKADLSNLEQVITNLCINARDAMPNGGIITIKTENVTLNDQECNTIEGAWPGTYVRISIADTGIGMNKETIKHIFDPFFTTKGLGKGTGLGLSVVYGILKAHNGWIDVYSEPAQGTIFKIYLPAVSSNTVIKSEEIIEVPVLKGNGEHILIIEDEEKVLAYLERILLMNGYLIHKALNSKYAIEVFKENSATIDLVMTDMILPDVNGLRTIEQLRQIKNNIGVIVCSGYLDDKSLYSEIQENGYKFIQKPVDEVTLLKTIKEILRNKKVDVISNT